MIDCCVKVFFHHVEVLIEVLRCCCCAGTVRTCTVVCWGLSSAAVRSLQYTVRTHTVLRRLSRSAVVRRGQYTVRTLTVLRWLSSAAVRRPLICSKMHAQIIFSTTKPGISPKRHGIWIPCNDSFISMYILKYKRV